MPYSVDNTASGALLSLIKNGSLPHAALFTGQNSAYNADLFAAAAVCSSGGEKPCGECSNCIKAIAKSHPDIIYCEPKKPNNPYPVDYVREIRRDAGIMPNEAAKKVYIFTCADNISAGAQNALLKIIEEPPAAVMFALCCNKKEQLLDTILSRVTVIPCGGAVITGTTEESDALAEKILLDTVFGNEYELLCDTFSLIKDKPLLEQTVYSLKAMLRCLYLAKSGVDTSDDRYYASVEGFIGHVTLGAAVRMSDAVEQTYENYRKNANAQLNITRLCAKLKSAVGK